MGPLYGENSRLCVFVSVILVVTVGIFISSTVWRNQLNSDNQNEKYESGFQFFMIILIHFFMPVLSIYPSVYLWYDYQTDDGLAYSPQGKFIER